MQYPIIENKNNNILDDRLITDAINKISNIIGKKLQLELNNDYELFELLNNPELFIDDTNSIYKIKEVNDLINIIKSIYNY